MSTLFFSTAWIGVVAFGVTILVAIWHMRKNIPPNMTPVAKQFDHRHMLAVMIARHDEAMHRFELYIYENRDWADTNATRAQHLLLEALGPLEAYCYETKRIGEPDEYYETRLQVLIDTLDPEADFSTMSETDN